MSDVATSVENRLTLHQLQAAHHVAKVISADWQEDSQLRRAYPKVATGGIHNTASLVHGQNTLEETGLLRRDGTRVAATPDLLRLSRLPRDAFVETLLLRHLTENAELWLALMASDDHVHWETVPEDVIDTLASAFPDAGTREGFLLNAARKVDQAALARFGLEGEETVVAACRRHLTDRGAPHLADDVAHVSLADDTLGYDVLSPDLTGRRHRLEVKATSAPTGWVEFYLSRNEATVGAGDPVWSLVVTRRELTDTGSFGMRVAGWLRFAEFSHLLPNDYQGAANQVGRGRWASCRISLPDHLLRDGLPLESAPAGPADTPSTIG